MNRAAPPPLLIRNTDSGVDIRCSGDLISEVGSLTRRPGEIEIDAAGGAVLPGLHDHHLHLFAWARARTSTACGPPGVRSPRQLATAIQSVEGAGWIRGVGYHESVAGDLDRTVLDQIEASRPVRVQHRSGKMWFLNSRALDDCQIDGSDLPAGVERDANGRPTGRLFRLDSWLRERLPEAGLPDVGNASRELARYGITGITDPTPHNDGSVAKLFSAALEDGRVLQRVRLMGNEHLPSMRTGQLTSGELKIMLDDAELPDIDVLTQRIADTHARQRSVAVHCVTRTELLFAMAAIEAAGPSGHDRIEHAGIAPAESLAQLQRAGITVVTQPNFISERGNIYRSEVDPSELSDLYRCRTLLEAGVPVALGADAPYGHPDPWRAMAAACDRVDIEGEVLGPQERVTAETALAMYTGTAEDPGRERRRIQPGQPADLCVLTEPWLTNRQHLHEVTVGATVTAGRLIYQAGSA